MYHCNQPNGCSSAKLRFGVAVSSEAAHVKSNRVKSSQVKSSEAKSSQSRQGKARQGKARPVQSSPVQSSQVQSSPVKSSQVQSSPVKSSQVQSSQVQSSQVQLVPHGRDCNLLHGRVSTSIVAAREVAISASVGEGDASTKCAASCDVARVYPSCSTVSPNASS